MKTTAALAALAMLLVVPCAARAQMMTATMYGAGPHGYDFEIGTWACTNSLPSPMGGPSHTTLRVTRTSGTALFYRSTGTNFDNSWYNIYLPKTKSWASPFIVSDGSYGTESTSQTGKKVVWVGTGVDGSSGKTIGVRDTIVMSATKTTDLGEYRPSGGAWKTQYNLTCTKE